MPTRPQLSDRLASAAPRGREAFRPPPAVPQRPPATVDEQRQTDDGRPSTVDGPPGRRQRDASRPAPSWAAQHKRLTFYCPIALIDKIEAEMAQSGRSKTAVIVDALHADLCR